MPTTYGPPIPRSLQRNAPPPPPAQGSSGYQPPNPYTYGQQMGQVAQDTTASSQVIGDALGTVASIAAKGAINAMTKGFQNLGGFLGGYTGAQGVGSRGFGLDEEYRGPQSLRTGGVGTNVPQVTAQGQYVPPGSGAGTAPVGAQYYPTPRSLQPLPTRQGSYQPPAYTPGPPPAALGSPHYEASIYGAGALPAAPAASTSARGAPAQPAYNPLPQGAAQPSVGPAGTSTTGGAIPEGESPTGVDWDVVSKYWSGTADDFDAWVADFQAAHGGQSPWVGAMVDPNENLIENIAALQWGQKFMQAWGRPPNDAEYQRAWYTDRFGLGEYYKSGHAGGARGAGWGAGFATRWGQGGWGEQKPGNRSSGRKPNAGGGIQSLPYQGPQGPGY